MFRRMIRPIISLAAISILSACARVQIPHQIYEGPALSPKEIARFSMDAQVSLVSVDGRRNLGLEAYSPGSTGRDLDFLPGHHSLAFRYVTAGMYMTQDFQGVKWRTPVVPAVDTGESPFEVFFEKGHHYELHYVIQNSPYKPFVFELNVVDVTCGGSIKRKTASWGSVRAIKRAPTSGALGAGDDRAQVRCGAREN